MNRSTDSVAAIIAGACIVELDELSKETSATCWSSSADISAEAWQRVRDELALGDERGWRRTGTADPSKVFRQLSDSLSSHEETFAGLAADIVESTRLLFGETEVVEDLSIYQDDGPSVVVVVPFRATPSMPLRAKNLEASIMSLLEQSLERHLYRIVVVEQAVMSQLPARIAGLVDEHVVIEDDGPFNRAQTLNRGAHLAGPSEQICLYDADLMVDRQFLKRNRALTSRYGALLPYTDLFCVQPNDSESLRRDAAPDRVYGYSILHPVGACIWLSAEVFVKTGGLDERFKGWGGEDREFHDRLESVNPVHREKTPLMHLYHERPAMKSDRSEILSQSE